ncbi:Integrase, catalytic domain containing protein [Comamonadaceae bacterium]
MKKIAPRLYARSEIGTLYVRRRIPKALKQAYPAKQTHKIVCLHTSDLRVAKPLQHKAEVLIEAEFSQRLAELKEKQAARAKKRLGSLSDEMLKSLAHFWVRQVLHTDDFYRELDSEDEFEEKGASLLEQRAELGRMLAMRRSDKILPAMHSFIHLCGLDVDMTPDESKRAGTVFLTAICTALDFRLQRQQGHVVQTDVVAPPALTPRELLSAQNEAQSKKFEWDAAFIVWRDYVPGRPKSTAIATQTPFLELKKLAALDGILYPEDVTPELMRKFVDRMAGRGLQVVTLNERLAKLKSLFKVLKGKGVVTHNPAADTLGLKENSFKKRKSKRQPFDQDDLTNIFSSCVFNDQQLRSQGQSQEATYWIPVMMYYTGARTEEIAGLALDDVLHDAKHGWYLNLIDRPSPDDDLFDDDEEIKPVGNASASAKQAHHRLLKNVKSIRRVPVAKELIELGLLRYLDMVKAEGHLSLFPSLSHDWHEKLSGSFSKFFGRYKSQVLGIKNPKKVLYSFRHTMKDAMTRANVDSMYLQRILGHASGLGDVTDGYGNEDVPLDVLIAEFSKVNFHPIPAKPWAPGKGWVKYPKR